MGIEEYREFGEPYERQVLQAAEKSWMNTLHAYGSNIIFQILKDYPVQVFNWHAWETLPTVDEAAALTGKCLMGGLNQTEITNCDRSAILRQIFECYRLLNGQGHILTPGCVIRYPLNESMLAYVREAKELVESRLARN